MVKVVPFIFLCYGIQCFTLHKIGQTNITGTTLLIMGAALAALTASFALYDLKHEVTLHSDHMTISFLWYKKDIPYNTILNMSVDESDKSFCKLKVSTLKSKHTFYFVDNGMEIKEWIQGQLDAEEDAQDFSNAA